MPRYEYTQEIAADTDAVWRPLANVCAWPKWLPTVSAVLPHATPELALGATYTLQQPRLRPAIWEVTALEPGQSFVWESSSPGLRLWAGHRLTPLDAGRTELHLEFRFQGLLAPLVGLFAGKLTRRYLQAEAAALRARAENAARAAA